MWPLQPTCLWKRPYLWLECFEKIWTYTQCHTTSGIYCAGKNFNASSNSSSHVGGCWGQCIWETPLYCSWTFSWRFSCDKTDTCVWCAIFSSIILANSTSFPWRAWTSANSCVNEASSASNIVVNHGPIQHFLPFSPWYHWGKVPVGHWLVWDWAQFAQGSC